MPFSKRLLASLRMPVCISVRRMLGPAKLAASSTMSVVRSSISASWLPNTPAMTRAPLDVGDDEHLVVEGALDAVERDDLLAGRGAAGDEPAAADLAGVERVQRLAPAEHHVVGDVDDVVDGAHAGVREARLEPGRRLADLRRRG